MVPVGDVARFVEVRDIGEFRPHPPVLADREMSARVHRPKRGGEGELFVLTELLIAEHKHGVAVHGRLNLARLRRVERPAQIDPVNAGGKERMQR